MKKTYEYKFITAEEYEDFIVSLNKNGKDGWDLVNYTIRDFSDSEGYKIHIQALMKKEYVHD
jgi:hypothetical protein